MSNFGMEGSGESSKKRSLDEEACVNPDVQIKRRGPSDCLNWDEDDEDEEFTPYTQENPVIVHNIPQKSFARKAVVKSSSTRRKGKCLGMFLIILILFCSIYCVVLYNF